MGEKIQLLNFLLVLCDIYPQSWFYPTSAGIFFKRNAGFQNTWHFREKTGVNEMVLMLDCTGILPEAEES